MLFSHFQTLLSMFYFLTDDCTFYCDFCPAIKVRREELPTGKGDKNLYYILEKV